jgi:hypothetical protein
LHIGVFKEPVEIQHHDIDHFLVGLLTQFILERLLVHKHVSCGTILFLFILYLVMLVFRNYKSRGSNRLNVLPGYYGVVARQDSFCAVFCPEHFFDKLAGPIAAELLVEKLVDVLC